MKNTGTKIWDKNTKLILDRSSDFICDEVILIPQKPNEEKGYKITIKDLSNYPVGEYRIIFSFWSGGRIYGDKITAVIKIIEKENINSEIDEFIDKIQDFRSTFNLPEKDYPNEKILEILKDNDFNYDNAFSSLFN